MSHIKDRAGQPIKDFDLQAASGAFGIDVTHKYARATSVSSGVDTDIWDRANGTDLQPIWVPPTEARIHNVASTDVNDTSAGTGARTIIVDGIVAWNSDRVQETVIMNGTSNVATVNSFLLIDRMYVATSGSSGPNVGDISATAVTDATVSAQINATKGQTQMAIFGVPSTKDGYLLNFYASINRAVSTVAGNLSLLTNSTPDTNMNNFLVKHTIGLNSTGTSANQHNYIPYQKFTGPLIFRLQINVSANGADISGGGSAIAVDK